MNNHQNHKRREPQTEARGSLGYLIPSQGTCGATFKPAPMIDNGSECSSWIFNSGASLQEIESS